MREDCGSYGTSRSNCSDCSISDCRVDVVPEGSPLAGWRLVAASIGLFLGPILLALAGTICFSSGPELQLLGAAAGLIVGIGGSIAAVKFMRRVDPEIL